jgi:hypothetical protein
LAAALTQIGTPTGPEDDQQGVAEGVETPQQQQVRAAISSGLAKSSQMGKAEYQSQPTNRTYFDNAGYASDKLTGIDSIDPDGTVVISIGDTRATDWVKKLAALGGMPGVKTREVQPKLAQGVAESYQLDEGAVETITALVKKIPGIGKYYQLAQQYKPQLIQILKTSKSGKEVKQKMEQLIAQQPEPVAESGLLKQLGGLAVGGGSILSTMWMNAMGMIDGVLAHAAAGEIGGAVASGSILGLIPVALMLFAAMLLFKGAAQSSDEKAQQFQAQRGQQGVAEGTGFDLELARLRELLGR